MLDISSEQITNDPVHRVLALVSAPLLVQNLVEVVQAVVDLFWVGRLGSTQVAALGLVFPVTGLLLIATIGIPYIGTQIAVSQRVGQDREQAARRATFNGLLAGAAFGVLLGGGAYLAAPTIVDLMTATRPTESGALSDFAVRYFRIISLGMVFAATSDAIEAAFVGRGDSRAAFYISVVTVATNVVADPILIFGLGPIPALGIEGAALATVLGYLTGLLLAVGMVLRGRRGGILTTDAFEVSFDEFRTLVEIGASPTGERAIRRVADILVVTVVFAAGGGLALTAYIVGTRVFSVASIPVFGLQQATQSVVGQNLGAGSPDRARRTTRVGVIFAGVALAVIGALQWAFAAQITTLLSPELTGRAFEYSVTYLRILAYGYPAFGVIYVIQGGFNGANRGRVSFLSSVFHYWLVQLPVAVLAGVVLTQNVVFVFWATTVGNLATGLCLSAYYLYVTKNEMFGVASREIAEASAAS